MINRDLLRIQSCADRVGGILIVTTRAARVLALVAWGGCVLVGIGAMVGVLVRASAPEASVPVSVVSSGSDTAVRASTIWSPG